MRKIEEQILNLGYRCVLFRKRNSSGVIGSKNYLIHDLSIEEVKVSHSGNRIDYIPTGLKASIRSIEKDIRLVFDHQGVLIARRPSPTAPLRFTGKGMGKRIKIGC